MSRKSWSQKLNDVHTLDDAEKVLRERKPQDSLLTAYTFLGQKMDVRYFELLRHEIDLTPHVISGSVIPLDFLAMAIQEENLLRWVFNEGRVDVVRYFLDMGLAPTTRVLGHTPLIWAIEGKKVDVVDVILAHHIAKVEEENVERRAKGEDEVSPVDLLYFQNREKVDAITYAIYVGDVDILKRFYIHGADFTRPVNVRIFSFRTVKSVNDYFSVAYFKEQLHVMNYFTGLGIVTNEMMQQCEISDAIKIINCDGSTDAICDEHLFLQRYVRTIPHIENLEDTLFFMRKSKRKKIAAVLEEEIARRKKCGEE
jgi:hypothetical protein